LSCNSSKIFVSFQEEPLHHGYHRVNTAESHLSPSNTNTSLDTILIDTSADPLTTPQPLNLPSSQQRSFNPILETGDTNPFKDDIKKGGENVKQSKQSLKGSRVSFGQNEEDTFDEDDDTNFKKRREHFQKNKSASTGHKSILIRVSNLVFITQQ
jgi:facilitated trehalose transporter